MGFGPGVSGSWVEGFAVQGLIWLQAPTPGTLRPGPGFCLQADWGSKPKAPKPQRVQSVGFGGFRVWGV